MPTTFLRTITVLAALLLVVDFASAVDLCSTGTRCFVTDETGRQRIQRYDYSLPANYDETEEYPLLIWLHGSGHRGLNGSHLTAGQFGVLQSQTSEDFPAVFLAPQLPSGSWAISNPEDFTLDIVAAMIDELSIDPKQVYLVGSSLGGFGVMTYLQEMYYLEQEGQLPASYPEFAAVAPLMGAWIYELDEDLVAALQEIPMWFAHSVNDGVVSVDVSREVFRIMAGLNPEDTIPLSSDLIVNNGPTATIGTKRFTEIPGSAHNISAGFFASDEVMSWMLSQALEVPEPTAGFLCLLACLATLTHSRRSISGR